MDKGDTKRGVGRQVQASQDGKGQEQPQRAAPVRRSSSRSASPSAGDMGGGLPPRAGGSGRASPTASLAAITQHNARTTSTHNKVTHTAKRTSHARTPSPDATPLLQERAGKGRSASTSGTPHTEPRRSTRSGTALPASKTKQQTMHQAFASAPTTPTAHTTTHINAPQETTPTGTTHSTNAPMETHVHTPTNTQTHVTQHSNPPKEVTNTHTHTLGMSASMDDTAVYDETYFDEDGVHNAVGEGMLAGDVHVDDVHAHAHRCDSVDPYTHKMGRKRGPAPRSPVTVTTSVTSDEPTSSQSHTSTSATSVATLVQTSAPGTTTTTVSTTHTPHAHTPHTYEDPTPAKQATRTARTGKKPNNKLSKKQQEAQQLSDALAASQLETDTIHTLHQQVEQTIRSHLGDSLSLLQVNATGDCFYHCINAATVSDMREFTYDDHVQLRRQLATHMLTRPIQALRAILPDQQITGDIMLHTGNSLDPTTISETAYAEATCEYPVPWCDATYAELATLYTTTVVLTPSAHATSVVITLAAHMTGRRIQVYNVSGALVQDAQPETASDEAPIRILTLHNGRHMLDPRVANHYELITSTHTATLLRPLLAEGAQHAHKVWQKQLTHTPYSLDEKRAIARGGVVANPTATLPASPVTPAHVYAPATTTASVAANPAATAPAQTTAGPAQVSTAATTAGIATSGTAIGSSASTQAQHLKTPTTVGATPSNASARSNIGTHTQRIPRHSDVPVQQQPSAAHTHASHVATARITASGNNSAKHSTAVQRQWEAASDKVLKPNKQPPHMPTHVRAWKGEEGRAIEIRATLGAARKHTSGNKAWSMSVDDRRSLVLSLIPNAATLTGITYGTTRVYTAPSSHTHILVLVFDTVAHATAALTHIPAHLDPILLEEEITGLVRGIPTDWLRTHATLTQQLAPWKHAASTLVVTRQGTKGARGAIDDSCFFAVSATQWDALRAVDAATLSTTHSHMASLHQHHRVSQLLAAGAHHISM
jgi:hypothetical protein